MKTCRGQHFKQHSSVVGIFSFAVQLKVTQFAHLMQ